MIRREKLHALILARRNVGEADRVVTCLTKEYGLLQLRASGVRKIPSRRGGHIEPFTHVWGIISGSPGRLYLAGVETLDYYENLRADHQALDQAQQLVGHVLALLPEEEPQPELFDALYHAWHILPDLPVPKRQALEVAINMCLLERTGILPDLEACHVCDINQPEEAVILDSQMGAWRCLSCHDSFAGSRSSLSPRLFKALRFLQKYPERALQLALQLEESEQIVAAMRQYMNDITHGDQPPVRDSFVTNPFSYGTLAS